jgi:fructokinase
MQPKWSTCNLLAMMKKAGKDVAFIGKVGNDMFGRMIK